MLTIIVCIARCAGDRCSVVAVAENRRNERHYNNQCSENGCHGKSFLSKYNIG